MWVWVCMCVCMCVALAYVVLCGGVAQGGAQIDARLVDAAVAKLHLVGARPRRH